jgi:hypothetical protein
MAQVVVGGRFSRARGGHRKSKAYVEKEVRTYGQRGILKIKNRQFIEYVYAGIKKILLEANIIPNEPLEKERITFVLGCVGDALSYSKEESLNGF